MNNYLEIKKVLNNNVIIASHPEHEEVVVIVKELDLGKKRKMYWSKNKSKKCLS